MSSSDDALIFGMNPIDNSLGGGDDADGDTEDPTGGPRHDMSHGSTFGHPRRYEQERRTVGPLDLLEFTHSKRIPLQQLSYETRVRDRDLYREGR